ncbi:hypothetical protein [Mesorhizobium sanjuanii]|uniref:hypothetical protein n=1 Tax=Mesorhizobium sanjuanii TaxID=2037900 RepID=UPI0013FE2AF4|nr:hypothetical protein [Mesorhizobium sanjuanii]
MVNHFTSPSMQFQQGRQVSVPIDTSENEAATRKQFKDICCKQMPKLHVAL